MDDPIRVKTYRSESAEASARLFQADATEAAKYGFQPTSQQWDGSTLTVVYQRQEPVPSAPSPQREEPVVAPLVPSHQAIAEAKPPIVKSYAASSHQRALEYFRVDAAAMATAGYQPVSQQWIASDSGRGCFWIVIIVILLITIIGILLLPFVMGGRNSGTLSVTYVYQGLPASSVR